MTTQAERKIPVWKRSIQQYEWDNYHPQVFVGKITKRGPRIRTLDFIEAGRTIFKITQLLGRPLVSFTKTVGGTSLPYRAVVWDWGARIHKGIGKETLAKKLRRRGITEFLLSTSGWVSIRIEKDLYASSFTTSKDPKEWERKQKSREQARTRLRKVKEVIEKLDRVEDGIR